MTRTLLEALALCLVAVATSLAILAVVGKPGGLVHTEPLPQPALVDPNPGEPVPAPAPGPASGAEPVPTESTMPRSPRENPPESPGPRETPFTDEEKRQEAAQPRSWWRRMFGA